MSLGNLKTSGNKGYNTPWQKAVIQLLKLIQIGVGGAISSDDLHGIVEIDDSNAHTLFPAVAGYRLTITDLLVTNADPDDGTKVEIRETDANGRLLWKGYAKAVNGGFNQPAMRTPISTTVGASIVVVCITSGADVVVCATGYKVKG